MGFIPALNSFIAGTPIVASEVNSNFAAIVDVVNGGINHENIVNGGITSELVAAGAITTVKLSDGAVTEDKLATAAVTRPKIEDAAIGTAQVESRAITEPLLGDAAVSARVLEDNVVSPIKAARVTHRTVTGNTTVSLGDVDSSIVVDSSSRVDVEVPSDATVSYPIGGVTEVLGRGSGDVFITAASGVSVLSPDNRTGARRIVGRYSSAYLRKLEADVWILQGSLG